VTDIILTQYDGAILGPIAKLLGWIMSGIYYVMENVFGIQNIGLAIIILTLVIYLCMFPVTYKQQKFSKLTQKMQPELQEVQKKYKGKKDQVSMQKMQEETQAIYEKYGTSPTGGCLYMFISFPILLALYRVINNVPAYIGSVKDIFTDSVNGIMATEGFADTMAKFIEDNRIAVAANFESTDNGVLFNSIIDVLYKMGESGWDALRNTFTGLSDVLTSTQESLNHVNFFLGLNIGESPWYIMREAFSDKAWLLLIGALLIPVVSWLTQVLNMKLMPSAASSDNDQMARQMKTMNTMMPLFSFVMCFTVPVGLGIYWIAGALFRSIQQILLNKHMEKINLDDIIAENREKAKKKREKMGISGNQISNAARMNTRGETHLSNELSYAEKEKMLEEANQKRKSAKAGSMTAKANMVREFNERNNK
jgi:YidC/Oxa1 family membrane protein insertase